jgi:hypothetical protein
MQFLLIFKEVSSFCLVSSVLLSFLLFTELSLFDLFEWIKVAGMDAIALDTKLIQSICCGVELLDADCVPVVHESNKNIERL